MELVSYTNSQQVPGSANSAKRLPPLNSTSGQLVKANEVGGKYTLGNSLIPHSLPPRNSLKANMDHQSGILDTWPAHSANQRPANMQLALNKYNSLIVSNSQAEGKPELTPKPKFLENLEKFLNRELKALGVHTTQNTSESRLQAYRETFEYLLEEFKTYKPLLAAIKNEYELMLAHQREKIRELEPLKQMLVTLADQCDHKLMVYREEEKFEIKQLKEEKKKLQDMAMQLNNDKFALQTQVDKLQTELAVEHEKFRNEQDKRKLLIIDLNDMKFQQEEAKMNELKREKKRNADGTPTEDASQDDPITLRIALKICRQNLTDAQKRLTKMEADYGDVIPRRDFVALENNFNEISAQNEVLGKDLKSVKTDLSSLKDYNKSLEAKVQELQQDIETMKGNNTPRPDWDRCGPLIEGGVDKWANLTNNKSSIQILDTLINELSGNNKTGKSADNFYGLGSSTDIPAHLRYEGKLKNLKLNKKDVMSILNELLKERMQQKSTKTDVESMSEFFINYLKKRHPSDPYEYSYSIINTFEKFAAHELITYFAGVLSGVTDEEIYFYENKVISDLVEYLKGFEVESGHVSKSDFKEALKGCFPHKTSDQIDNLIRTIEEEMVTSDSSKIDYKSLFAEEGNLYTKSSQTFKNYLKDERLNLASKIMDQLGSTTTVNHNDVNKAIMSSNSSISEKNIEKIINWCFGSEKQMDFISFKKKLENGCLYNYPNF